MLAQAGAVGIGARPEGEAAAPTVLAMFLAIEVGFYFLFFCGELGALKSCQRGATWPQPLLPTASTTQGPTCQDKRRLFFYNIKGCFYDLES